MRRTTIALALVLVPATCALARVGSPEVGSRVRATISSRSAAGAESLDVLPGIWVGVRQGSLLLRAEALPDTLALRLDRVTRLEVSRGLRGHAGDGAVIGLVVGIAVGAPVGAAAFEAQKDDFFSIGSSGQWALGYGAALGAIGALAGAWVGSAHKSERWEPVPLEGLRGWRGSLPPERDVRLGLRIDF